jgi:hypothetical protein
MGIQSESGYLEMMICGLDQGMSGVCCRRHRGRGGRQFCKVWKNNQKDGRETDG